VAARSYALGMTQCRHCRAEIEATFRFCPWCAGSQRSKLVEFFRGVDEDEHRALRVSRYLPEKRVRVSVWDETGTARAAVSLDDDEAARLAAFLAPPPERARPRLLDELRTLVRR
jgi:hypothetical protein